MVSTETDILLRSAIFIQRLAGTKRFCRHLLQFYK